MSVDIDDLDASLAEDGEDIVLRRLISGVQKSVTVRAHVRSYRLSATDLVAGISNLPFIVVISPSQILAEGWPQGAPAPAAPPFDVDPAIPVKGDTVVIKGQVRTVKSVDPRAVDGEVVRIQMMVEG